MKSDRKLRNWYKDINRRFFDSELPNDTCVRYVDEEDKEENEKCEEQFYGWADIGDARHKYLIVISKPKNPGKTATLNTLVHEMCHLANNLNDDHGPAFERQRQRIADKGIFRKGAVLKHLTIF